MLRVKGKESDIETVMMPSECLSKFHQDGDKVDKMTPFFWAIKTEDPKNRHATLITPDKIHYHKGPGVKIVPAYPRRPL